MKSYKRVIFSSIIACAASISLYSVPAKPGLITVRQQDGTELPVRIMGDERHHFYLSDDGYLLINDHDSYYYGNVDASGNIVKSELRAVASSKRTAADREYLRNVDMPRVYERLNAKADEATQRAAKAQESAAISASGQQRAPRRGPGLFDEVNFPAHGDQKAIVILVEYTDTKMNASYDAHDYFNRMLNEQGFSDYGGTGSARDFFLESSTGQFSPEFDLYGPITLDHNMAYYGGNDWYGNDQRPEEMIIEACQKLDDQVDFSQYDRDGDGYIDNVFVFYAGRGEASGGASNTVWPHSWNVTAATYEPYVFDGVRLDRYACSNEWEGGRPDGVGTFVHEFSHVLGLPDLYATSYTSAFTPGSWSALDYGPYNNDGCTPPLYSAFERYALDWIEPLEISGPLNATLYPIGTNQCGIIPTSKTNEFFLLENRQQTSWDSYIPGHGMLIWHIDYNRSVWSSNTVNNTASHQYVDIEEADGSKSEYTRDGDAFPGTWGITSFTDTTSPSMKTWSGQSLGLPITEIAESADGVITFKVCGGREPLLPTIALEADSISSDGFTARWESAGEDASYVLNVFTRADAGRDAESGGDPDADGKIYLEGYRNLNVGKATSFEVSGTVADTEYFYTVSVGDGWEVSAPSNEISVITGRLPITRLAVEAEDARDITSGSFVAQWQPLEDAEEYVLNVYTKEYGAPLIDVCDFTDGVENLPEGWSSTSGAGYANAAYSGEAVPALRLSTSRDLFLTPAFDDEIRSFSMWSRGNSTSETDLVKIERFADGEWLPFAEFPVVKQQGGVVSEFDSIPAGTVRMRVSYVRTGEKGALAIDDVKVGHGMTFSRVPLAGLDSINVGNATEYEVTGLDASTNYYYTVSAFDSDGLQSKLSKEIEVLTSESQENAVGVVAGSSVQIKAEGKMLMISGAEESALVQVFDPAGRVVAKANADSFGEATIRIPEKGIYIVAVANPMLKKKIAVK